MKHQNLPRVLYCGRVDPLSKKISRNADDFVLETRPGNLGSSPQKLAQSRKASVVLLKIKKEFDLKHQEWLARNDGSVPVIVLCQEGNVQTAIQALQYGIFDYFCTSQSLEVILKKIGEAILAKSVRIARRIGECSGELLQGRSPDILRINEQARDLTRENKSVLLFGESGTGKEHLAYAMCRLTDRKLIPFVRYDCRLLHQISQYDGLTVPELIQMHLQQFKRKSSTGVLFLSHLEELTPDQQSEVLDRGFRQSIRLIASCQEKQAGFLQEKPVASLPSLRIPALRHRKEDIPILANHFIRMSAQKRRVRMKPLSEEILLLMQEHTWPGNVQELSNLIERMILMEPLPVLTARTWRLCQAHGLKLAINGTNQFSTLIESVLKNGEGKWKRGSLYDAFMLRMEKILIDLVLPKVDSNQAIAAKILGISRNTLRERLKEQ